MAVAGAAHQGFLHCLRAVAVNACVVRFRLDRPIGALYLLAAVLDPFVYAGTIYFVLATIFGRDDPARFHTLLLGLIAFRWTLSCLIHGLNLPMLRERFSESSRFGYAHGIAAIVAPPTLSFLISLSLALIWSIVAGPQDRSLETLWALPGVILFQLLWNCIFVIAVGMLRRNRIVTGQAPIIAVAAIVWFLSPIMYRLDDIPKTASLLLTSYNPVTHVIAAYQNTYWYGNVPSIAVLPAATALAVAAIVLFWQLEIRRARPHPATRYAATPATTPQISIVGPAQPVLTPVPAGQPNSPAWVFSRWQNRVKDIRGAGLVRLILAVRGLNGNDLRSTMATIKDTSGLDHLFQEDVGIYPDSVQDQLAFAIAIESPAQNLILNGILNGMTPAYCVKAWHRVAQDAAKGRLIAIVTDRQLPLPPTAQLSVRGQTSRK